MDHDLVDALRLRGIDLETADEAGLRGLADEEHLAFAAQNGRVLVSFNIGDFFALHTDWLNAGRSHAGIVLAPQQTYSVGEFLRRILKLHATLSADEMRDRVEFLSAWN